MHAIKTILIIDDDEDDRDMFCEAVSKISQATKCSHANDGTTALQLLATKNTQLPDFIFLDLNMPGINGKQCLQEIKKIDSARHIPVFIYSTSNHYFDREETKQLGAAGYLHKPTRFDVLCKELQKILA